MASRTIATVGWGSVNSAASLYGSALTLDPSGSARLVNRLMPSGTTIQEWYSFTDYQSLRDAPELPLLQTGRRYRVDLQAESVPAHTLIVEVRFFDRFDELLGTQVLHPPGFGFDYPADCHYYTVRLVNGGCDELRFTSLTLLEGDGDG